MKNISTIDLVVIVLYLAGIVGAGVWVGLRKRKAVRQEAISLPETLWPGLLSGWLCSLRTFRAFIS